MINIGKAKAIFDRQRGYLGIINFILLIRLNIVNMKMSLIEIMAIIIGVIVLFLISAYIDTRYIMPKEFEYLHRKSPVMKELLKK